MTPKEKADIRSSVIGYAIECSLKSVTQEEWEIVAPWFIKTFLPKHHIFTGDEVLEAFRATKHPIALRNWRNRWGGLMSHWCAMGYMVKIGKSKVKAIHSHMDTLCQYRSNYYQEQKATNEFWERVPNGRDAASRFAGRTERHTG
jgi:hypothetical protein